MNAPQCESVRPDEAGHCSGIRRDRNCGFSTRHKCCSRRAESRCRPARQLRREIPIPSFLRREIPHSCSHSRRKSAPRENRSPREFIGGSGFGSGSPCKTSEAVMRVASVRRFPNKDDRSARAYSFLTPDGRFHFLQVCFATESVDRAKIHRHAVLHDAILLENLVEHFERTSAINHEIFRDDLKPIDDRLLFQDVAVMRHAQADSDAVVVEILKWIGGRDLKEEKKKRSES